MARKTKQKTTSAEPKGSSRPLVNSTNTNLRHIMLVFLICCSLVIVNVLYTMFSKTHLWSQHSALTQSVSSSLVQQTVTGKRGTIYDRNHLVLAQETPAYTIVARFDHRSDEEKKQEQEDIEAYNKIRLAQAQAEGAYNYDHVADVIKDEQEKRDLQYVQNAADTAAKLKSVLGDSIDVANITKILENGMSNENTSQSELGLGTKRLDKSVMEALKAAKIPGIDFVETNKRSYPSTPFSSNLIGFADYSEESGSIEGKIGLERNLNMVLSGKDGEIQYQKSSEGNILPGTSSVLSTMVPGDDVNLTLDSNLQQLVEKEMQITMDKNKAESAWCLVMEVETGRILAWASYPTFNQNTHLDIPSYTDIISETAYEPGSVMKPFVYAAAVDSGVFPYNTMYRAGSFVYTYDPENDKIIRVTDGSATGNPPILDALGTDYGTLTFEDGLAHSSNVAICELLSNYLDKKTFDKYLDSFGFFKKTNTDHVNQATGVKNIDDPTSYLSTGFGQASSITILQLAQAYTAIFNDGVMMTPYVVDSVVDTETGEVIEKHEPTIAGTPISAETANEVKGMMHNVLSAGMSGERFAMDNVDMTAKTGTGEIYRTEVTGVNSEAFASGAATEIKDFMKDVLGPAISGKSEEKSEENQSETETPKTVYGVNAVTTDGHYDTQTFTSSIMAAAPYDDPKVMVYWGMVSPNYINYDPDEFQAIMQQALIVNSVNGGTSDSQTSQYEKWESYTMPSLINHTVEYAKNQMDGKKVNTVIIGDGTNVTDQFPKAGTAINSNDNVLILTDGDTLTMPDLIGWTRKDLTAFWQLTGIAIEHQGFGKVTQQNIEPGTLLSRDMEIVVQLE
ncbi:MAG: penicillin-binding protein [Erysipelotrichaceae bacterium]|nr:penicillin-binding protein [Erysipelotrichaceae bacterium]